MVVNLLLTLKSTAVYFTQLIMQHTLTFVAPMQ